MSFAQILISVCARGYSIFNFLNNSTTTSAPYDTRMRPLLVYVFALSVLALNTNAITLYNATEWRSVSSFTATNGNAYTIYKPVCTGMIDLLILPTFTG